MCVGGGPHGADDDGVDGGIAGGVDPQRVRRAVAVQVHRHRAEAAARRQACVSPHAAIVNKDPPKLMEGDRWVVKSQNYQILLQRFIVCRGIAKADTVRWILAAVLRNYRST